MTARRCAAVTVIACCGLAVSACAGQTEPEPSRADAADARAAVVPERSGPPDDLAARPPSRGKVLGGEKVTRVVQWPAAPVAAAREALPAPVLATLDDAPVPVLAPTDPEVAATAGLVLGEDWAAVSMHADGFSLALDISGTARIYPHIKPVPGTHPVRDTDGFVTRNEGIWVASWREHGVAYQLSMECARLDDARCTEATLMGFVDDLAFAGGRGEGAR